jgi:hypothetical protein
VYKFICVDDAPLCLCNSLLCGRRIKGNGEEILPELWEYDPTAHGKVRRKGFSYVTSDREGILEHEIECVQSCLIPL